MPVTVKVSGNGITLELLLWRHGKRRGHSSARLTETIEMNPGISAFGPYLPLGTLVTLPDLPPVSERSINNGPAPVSLFD